MRGPVVGVILAAGRSTRMGERNKLTTDWKGKPLVLHVTEAALKSHLLKVIVVTGHQANQLATLLGPDVIKVHNPDYRDGMASSLRAGIAQGRQLGAAAILILLGDMPLVTSHHIDLLLHEMRESPPDCIVQALGGGRHGNPVLFPACYFDELLKVEGDNGAKTVIEAHREKVKTVEIGQAARRDFDTVESFQQDN